MENKETSVGAFIYKIEKGEILFLLVFSKRNKGSFPGFPMGLFSVPEVAKSKSRGVGEKSINWVGL